MNIPVLCLFSDIWYCIKRALHRWALFRRQMTRNLWWICNGEVPLHNARLIVFKIIIHFQSLPQELVIYKRGLTLLYNKELCKQVKITHLSSKGGGTKTPHILTVTKQRRLSWRGGGGNFEVFLLQRLQADVSWKLRRASSNVVTTFWVFARGGFDHWQMDRPYAPPRARPPGTALKRHKCYIGAQYFFYSLLRREKYSYGNTESVFGIAWHFSTVMKYSEHI